MSFEAELKSRELSERNDYDARQVRDRETLGVGNCQPCRS